MATLMIVAFLFLSLCLCGDLAALTSTSYAEAAVPQYRLVRVLKEGELQFASDAEDWWDDAVWGNPESDAGVWTCVYDSRGNMLERRWEGNEGEIISTEFSYDDNDNLLSETRIAYGDTISEKKWTYHEDGTKILDVRDFPSSTLARDVYDASNNIVETIAWDAEGNIRIHFSYSYDYTYDSSGNLLCEEVQINSEGSAPFTTRKTWAYEAGGKVLTEDKSIFDHCKYSYTYDSSGRWLTRTKTIFGTDYYEYTTYQYDSNGNRILETCELFYSDHSSYTIEYEYNLDSKQTKRTRTTYDSDGTQKVEQVDFYDYHPNGKTKTHNMTKYRSQHPDTIRYIWKYDEYGNTLERTIIYGDYSRGESLKLIFEYEKI